MRLIPESLNAIFKKHDGKWPDPPHPLTLLVNLLTVCLAGGAFYVSSRSYGKASESLEVGQRAYLSVVTKKLILVDLDTFPEDVDSLSKTLQIPKPQVNENHYVRKNMVVEMSITNSGNTPAKLLALTMSYDGPKDWFAHGLISLGGTARQFEPLDGLVDIGPKESIERVSTLSLFIPGDAQELQVSQPARAGQAGRLAVRAHVLYKDVFNVVLERENCVHDTPGFDKPLACQESLIDISIKKDQDWLDSHSEQKPKSGSKP